MRRPPPEALALARRWEGLAKVGPDGLIYPYTCPAGYPTQGYGRLVSSLTAPPITRQQAGHHLLEDLESHTEATLRICPPLADEPDERLAAIVDFCFNLGAGRLQASTLRRRVNQRDWPEAAYELRRWVWAGGRKLPGLVARREAEAGLLLRSA